MIIFKKIGALLTNLDTYTELAQGKWQTVAKIFLVGLFMINGLAGLRTSILLWRPSLEKIQHLADTMVSWYPPDQIITWNEHRLSFEPLNQSELKVLGWPPDLGENPTAALAIYSPTLVVDPTQIASTSSQGALFLVDPENLWLNQLGENWSEPVPLSQLPFLNQTASYSWDRTAIINLVGEGHRQIRQGWQILLLIWPITNVVWGYLQALWFAVTQASLLWLFARIINWKLSWKKLVKLNLAIVVVARAVEIITLGLYPELTWSFFHITYWVIMALLSLSQSPALRNK
ncbi:MAG TPA: hypothetical protein DEP87_03300 [Candidatus Pacebacteria bacterium]|nr:hypothetical protein [Candidatus Paceibacterota bacterium]